MREQPEARLTQILVNPVRRFLHLDAAAGILLFAATVAALVWANLPKEFGYQALWQTPLRVGFGAAALNKPLLLWINDGLMAVFFFMVGLEIKREVLAGELSRPRQAVLPVLAALGGMIVPALIYFALNPSGPGSSGWGIPMATDIAFALGILSLFGSRVPIGLKVFLTALAIADDIGAVLVIALFYSSDISLVNLGLGFCFLLAMFVLSRAGVRSPVPYAMLGIGGLWLAFLLSGVHATIAGVLAAFAIPATVRIKRLRFVEQLSAAVDSLRGKGDSAAMLSHEEQRTVGRIEAACEEVQPPLQRLEHALHPWVMYLIMPVFALANAGVALSTEGMTAAGSMVALGIVLGLIVGKFVGVSLFSLIAVRLGWADLPEGATWTQVMATALLAGVGFTMSLFVSGLAFRDPGLGDAAKLGILTASGIAGLAGAALLFVSSKPKPQAA